MRNLIGAVSIIALMSSLGACATVTRGTTTELKITSTPPGASVRTSTGFSCDTTPCSIKVPRKTEMDVTLAKTGYTSKTVHVRSVLAGAGAAGFVGNVVLGGGIGMVVDGVSGATADLSPNPLDVTLDAVAVADATPAAATVAAAAPAPAVAPASAAKP